MTATSMLPMLIGTGVFVVLWLIPAGMARSLERKVRAIDAAARTAFFAAPGKKPTHKVTAKAVSDSKERWVQIARYRRASGLLLMCCIGFITLDAVLLSVLLLPWWWVSAAILAAAVGGLWYAWKALTKPVEFPNFTKAETPLT